MRYPDQVLGIDVMDKIKSLLEAGYKKLYRYIRGLCKEELMDSDFEVPPLMISAIAALQDRPVWLTYCLEEIAATRSKLVHKAFLVALTQGGPTGIPRPIELVAHDPHRFLSDMTAWIHQTLANEHELLSNVLSKMNKTTPEQKEESHQQLVKLLNVILASLCRPFTTRLQHVMNTNKNVVVAYQLAHCLEYYKDKFSRTLMSPEATLVRTFFE